VRRNRTIECAMQLEKLRNFHEAERYLRRTSTWHDQKQKKVA
jgi:hypothetical protein